MKEAKRKTASVKLFVEDKEYIESLVTINEEPTMAHMMEKVIKFYQEHNYAPDDIVSNCKKCDMPIPGTIETDLYSTHCSRCRDIIIDQLKDRTL